MFKLGVVGYSAPVFDESTAQTLLQEGFTRLIPRGLPPTEVAIVSGYTNMGVPRQAYLLADQLGYNTVGLSANEALDYDKYPVDRVMLKGEKFGDESAYFIGYIDALLKVGGGKQSVTEYEMFTESYPDKPKLELDLPMEESDG